MKSQSFIFLILIFISPFTYAFDEGAYFKLRSQLQSQQFAEQIQTTPAITSADWGAMLVQALDEIAGDQKSRHDFLFKRIQWLLAERVLSPEDTLSLLLTFKQDVPQIWNLHERLILDRISRNPTDKVLFLVFRDQRRLSSQWQELVKKAEAKHPWLLTPKKQNRYQLAKDLLMSRPPLDQYLDGRYHQTPMLYMFCREDRSYPCIMLMREPGGEIRRRDNGEVWSQPALGYSRHFKEFNEVNGNTPSGVFRIDGVMPYADNPVAYGKYRRLILNFIGASKSESEHKKLLPSSSHSDSWWQEAVVARDIGRDLFRIHGTGQRSPDGANFHPFFATSGCVAQRENTYGKVSYHDQRLLLNELIAAMELPPEYSSEEKLRGLLYLINIDAEKRAVKLEDLVRAGILD